MFLFSFLIKMLLINLNFILIRIDFLKKRNYFIFINFIYNINNVKINIKLYYINILNKIIK